MSTNSIASLSAVARAGGLAAASEPPVSEDAAGADLDLDLDLDFGLGLFGGDSLFAARSDMVLGGALGAASAADMDQPQENGSGTGTFSVAASGNQGIDGLLSGVAWSGGFITYSFPDSSADYQAGHPELPFTGTQLSAAQQLAAHFALNDATYTQPAAAIGFSIEGFTNLGITWTSDEPGGTVRLINSNKPGTAYAYYPSTGVWGGDAFFGPSGSSPVMGNYHWHTILHEIGHALGLKHGQESSVYGALPSYLDSMEYSVMTYRSYVGAPLNGYTNETYGYAQTYMMYDIAALQYMYGADFTTNSGNTVYSWTPGSGNTVINGSAAITPGGNRIFMTVWDGGGIDTYDASAYTGNVTINLAPGGYSLLSSTQQAYLGGGNYARGNVFNALQYNGDARSLIENATGGSGNDNLYGNAANNVLTGNAGNDYMWSSTGNDSLYGGDGNDSLYGAEGNDYNTGDAGNDYIWAYDGADTAYGGLGNDTIYGGNDNDWLVGDDGSDYVSGDAGNDIVFGGDGVDSLYGGDGDDGLYAGQGNVIDAVNDGGAGNDLLYYGYFGLNGYSFDHELNQIRNGAGTVVGTMAGIETLYGGYGNDIIWSDGNTHTYYGLGGDDLMIAAVGAETMYGGTGIDTLDLTLWDGAYNLNMATGASNYGGELYLEFERVLLGDGNDTVLGTANADTIDGGLGTDSMTGLGGDDVYYVNSKQDVVVEASGGGTDWIMSSVNKLTLAAWVENLQLLGSVKVGNGNGLNNVLYGNGAGNTLNGKGGADTLYGFGGNDTYVVGTGDVVVEALGQGNDTVKSNVDWRLEANLENLVLTGGADIDGRGNELNNRITGNSGDNELNGGAGNDTLMGLGGADTLIGMGQSDIMDGGNGNDLMTGDFGADIFIYRAGADRITDFLDNTDTLHLDDALWGGGLTIAQVLATYATVVAGDTIFNFGGGNNLTLDGIANKNVLADDIVLV